jgi:AcrR family transcriptional regulator
MADNVLDRRVQKTRQIIYEAFFELMKEKQYDKITVQEIIDRANVGRSTFYSHFVSKDELLENSIENLMSMLDLHLSYINNNGKRRLIAVEEFFKHIKENNRLMRSLIKGKSADLFVDKVQTHLNKNIETQLSQQFTDAKDPTIPLPILINFISSTLISLLKWWLENKMKYTPEQMEQYFHKLVTPSIEAILNGEPS